MKYLSKLIITSLITTSLFFTSIISVNATTQSFNPIEPSIDSIDTYNPILNVIDGETTRYICNEKSVDEITKTLEDEINKDTKNSRYASGYYSLELIGKSRKSTGLKKIANQPAGGVSFSHGGKIYYKDGSSFSVPLSLSAAGKVFGFSIGIGSFSKSPTTYGINIPKGASYHGYVNKTYDLYAYKQYYNSPNGGKIFDRYIQKSIFYGIDFVARKV